MRRYTIYSLKRFSSVFLFDVYVDRKCLCAAGADGGVRPSVHRTVDSLVDLTPTYQDLLRYRR